MLSKEEQKALAGKESFKYVKKGMVVGLGTGSTAKYAVEAIGNSGLEITGVPTSTSTQEMAMSFNIPLLTIYEVDQIDVAIDGADFVDVETGVCIKGGGGAHYIEKRVAEKAKKFVVIIDEGKLVKSFKGLKVPLEIDMAYKDEVVEDLRSFGLDLVLREGMSDSDNLVGDVIFDGFGTLEEFHDRLMEIDGILDTGVFSGMIDVLIIAKANGKIEIKEY
jgi:ribose 5-phosphate isomerase A